MIEVFQSEEFSMAIGFTLLTVVTIIFVCILLNPDFWQGLRNTKYLDELLAEEMDEDDDDYLPEITRKTTKRGRK